MDRQMDRWIDKMHYFIGDLNFKIDTIDIIIQCVLQKIK